MQTVKLKDSEFTKAERKAVLKAALQGRLNVRSLELAARKALRNGKSPEDVFPITLGTLETMRLVVEPSRKIFACIDRYCRDCEAATERIKALAAAMYAKKTHDVQRSLKPSA